MRPIKTFLLAVHIEYHWRLIRRWQKQGVQFIKRDLREGRGCVQRHRRRAECRVQRL